MPGLNEWRLRGSPRSLHPEVSNREGYSDLVESPAAGGCVLLVPLVSGLIPESCPMLEVSGVVGTGAALVVSVGVVGADRPWYRSG